MATLKAPLTPSGIQALIDSLDVEGAIANDNAARDAAIDVARFVSSRMRELAHVDSGALKDSIATVNELGFSHFVVKADPVATQRTNYPDGFHYASTENARGDDHAFGDIAFKEGVAYARSKYGNRVNVRKVGNW